MFWYFVFKSVFYYSKVTKSFADLQRIFLEKMQIFGDYFGKKCRFWEDVFSWINTSGDYLKSARAKSFTFSKPLSKKIPPVLKFPI